MSIRLFNPSGGFIDLNAGGDGTAANTFTLPAETGTVLTTGSTFAGTGPAFSAYKSVAQSISTATTTKATFPSEEYDTASCYDASTSTFTPNVAGYYQFIFCGQNDTVTSGRCQTWLYKNGAAAFFKEENLNGPGSTYPSRLLSCLVYANGTTDYFEIYVRQESGTNKELYGGGTNNTVFQGYLVRAA